MGDLDGQTQSAETGASEGSVAGAWTLSIDERGRVMSLDSALGGWPFDPDMLGRPVATLFDDEPRFAHSVERALAGKPCDLTLERSGRAYEVYLVPRDLGHRSGLLLILLDVTPRGETWHQIHDWRLSYERILQMVPAAIWTTDRRLRITHLIGRAPSPETIPVPPESLIGRSLPAVLDELGLSEKGPLIRGHRAALAGRSATFRETFRGKVFDIALVPLRDQSGEIVGCTGASLDVTHQERLAEKAARERQRLVDAQRLVHLGLWEWEIGTNRVTWSDELYRIYGLEPASAPLTFETFLQHVHPHDAEQTRAVILRALDEGPREFEVDHRIIRPDGAVRMLTIRGDVQRSEHERPARIVGLCWDITDRWQAMRELEQSVSLLRATLESTADGILVVDAEGRSSAVNQRFVELWNIDADLISRGDDAAMLRGAAEQLVDPDSFLQLVRSLYENPELTSFDVLHFRDGRVFERYSQPQKVGEEVVGRVWSFRDVTESEQLLRRTQYLSDATRLLNSLDAEEALEAVARLSVPLVADVCSIDLTGNGNWRKLIVVAGGATRALQPELPQAVYSGHSALFAVEGVSVMAVPLMAHSRLIGVLCFERHSRTGFTGADLKVSEELARRAALALENARLYAQARDALQRREDFLAIAAHEIRGPITSVHLAVQTLQRAKIADAAKRKALQIIEREDRRLAKLVEELLDVTRIRSGQLHFEFEDVDLAAVVADAVSSLREELERSRSSLSIHSEQPVHGWWDRTRIEQVVTNLVSNAIKYGDGKPIDITLAHRSPATAIIEVRDQGIGISREASERVFDPFERAVSSRNYGGLGLGLYIVRTVVEGLGGSVTLHSELGRGSVFTVQLPAEPVQ